MENQRHPFFWILLLAAGVIAYLYIPVGNVIHQYGALKKDLGYKVQNDGQYFLVQEVEPHGYAAGKLIKGDRIIAVNGKANAVVPGTTEFTTPSFSGENYNVTVLRDNKTFDLNLRARIGKNSRQLPLVLTPLISSFVFFLIALVIGFAKPDKRFTQLFTFTWLNVALIYMALAIEPMKIFFGKSELNLCILLWTLSLCPLGIATAYHFGYLFPPGVPKSRFWSLLGSILYLCAGLLTIVFTFIRASVLFGSKNALTFFSTHSQLSTILNRSSEVLIVVAMIAICCLIVRNLRQIREANQRRQLQWVLCGTLGGTIPGAIYMGSKLIVNWIDLDSTFVSQSLYFLSILSNVSLELVPLSVGYAIIKHRMFDIHVVVRQSLRYLFAKNVLRILIYLPAAILIYTIVKNRDRNALDVLFSNAFYILLTVMAVIWLKFRNRFSSWLDRKFFREAYNSERILVSLIEEIKNFNSISEMSKWVTMQLDSALHPTRVLVFYKTKEKGDLVLGHSSGDHSHNLSIPRASRFLQIAETIAASVEFPSRETSRIPDEEKELLKELGIYLIVPMNDSEHRLVGLLLLGEKKSEQPYSSTDRKMLESLAGQIAVICENLLLKEHVDHELRIKREVLSHLKEQNRNLIKECPECGRCYDTNELNCVHDQRELCLSLPVDRVVDKKYRLDKLLGRGGMGAVYQATDLGLNREVAIKVLIGSMFGDRIALRRFEREARASARLDHPNIITVYDFGSIEGEGAYLVMELLHGFTLRSYLNENGNLNPVVAAGWFDQILEGMKGAHQTGVIHRDLKPENILLARKEERQILVKLLDFGLAKTKFLEPAESKSITAPGTVLGTLHYMSPEQIMGNEVDERTDIFSIGVMVIEALTGALPFKGATSSEVALSIIQKSFELEGECEEIKSLNSVLQKCIAKKKTDRYDTVEKLQKDLIESIRNVPPFPSAVAHPSMANSAVETRIVL
jgi:eukaryotic-like serine/threonine-protein kinase